MRTASEVAIDIVLTPKGFESEGTSLAEMIAIQYAKEALDEYFLQLKMRGLLPRTDLYKKPEELLEEFKQNLK